MMFISLLAIPIMAALNQFRGGGAFFQLGRFTEKLPGRPGWYCVPAVAALGLFAWAWPWAGYWGLCWLAWTILPWGRWFRPHLGIVPHADGKFSLVERIIEGAAFGNAYAAFTLRNLVSCLPLIWLSPWLLILAPLQTLLYAVIQDDLDGEIMHCELATGAMWGAALVLEALL
jgi:hypothetical protein